MGARDYVMIAIGVLMVIALTWARNIVVISPAISSEASS
jgi:hypothetical protein